ncbi:MAG: DUF1080 domain-containing protein [Planctomycetota bacterium]|nr:DUF1080 domain-containing protein [Planctomycetota bacterium]
MIRSCLFVALAIGFISVAQAEEGWKELTNGKDFTGWKVNEENPSTWTIKDGAFVAHGERSHIFYDGPEQPMKDFELKVDVLTEKGANGGIYIHTKYQPNEWPKEGYEIQVNNSKKGDRSKDPKKTASVYGVKNIEESPVGDNEWYTYHIIVKGKTITVKINDKVVNEFTEEPDRQPGKDFTRILSEGTIGFQAHDPHSIVHYKNVRLKK